MYLIDANVFIEAKNKYYNMAFCPAFWDWLLRECAGRNIFSIHGIYQELINGNDELRTWSMENRHFFLPMSDEDTQRNLATVAAHVVEKQNSVPMSAGAMEEFLRGADTWLIAKAMATGATIVTHERLDLQCKRKFLIPNVCNHFGVQYIDTFTLLQQLNASFVLAA
ncbi:DUF4411 family protein [Enterobacter sp. 155105]|uniref:DUF4411 family protein n=1 Tax=Enterobacter sp. 155105 TaxID=2980499 RepID=UPI0021CB12AD|nr:DUF4411 family protein [Enterobacter sp. 155105]UXP22322.1 DUF4411 family protein [Enterobacter sp. 155105]